MVQEVKRGRSPFFIYDVLYHRQRNFLAQKAFQPSRPLPTDHPSLDIIGIYVIAYSDVDVAFNANPAYVYTRLRSPVFFFFLKVKNELH